MFGAIVVGTDGSETSARAVEQAAALARATGSTLHLVRAYKLASMAVPAAPEAMGMVAAGVSDTEITHQVESELAAVAAQLEERGTKVDQHAVADPSAARALIQVAEAEHAGLLVVGNKGMKGMRRILGSVPNSVTHEAPCAVMIVPTC